MNFLTGNEKEIRITVHAQPKASRTKLVGIHGDALKIAVQAPPVEGAANEAIVGFLADFFSVAKRQITLKSGDTGRRKIFLVSGIGLEKAKDLIKAAIPC